MVLQSFLVFLCKIQVLNVTPCAFLPAPENCPSSFASVNHLFYTAHLVTDLAKLHEVLLSAGRIAKAYEIKASLQAFGDWAIRSAVQDASGYFNSDYSVSSGWSVDGNEVRATAPTGRALVNVYKVTKAQAHLDAATEAADWFLDTPGAFDSATGKVPRYSSDSPKSYISYSQVPFGLFMADYIEVKPSPPSPPKAWCGAAPMYRDGVVNSSLSAADSFGKAFLPLLLALLSLSLWVVIKRRKKD